MIGAIEVAGIDLTKAESEADLKAVLTRKLSR
jgi:hypothetical protein